MYRMPARVADRKFVYLLFLSLTIVLTACTAADTGGIQKIALLAPFEGQYREIGYNAHHALLLAFADSAAHDIHYLAVDDGGSVASATLRIRALNLDPAVKLIIALGPFATHPDVQRANERPLILVGNWGHDRADDDSYYLANQSLAQQQASGDLLMLAQVQYLYDSLVDIQFASSGSLPSADYRSRYLANPLYPPEPNLLATLSYDAARLALVTIQEWMDISEMSFQGLYGEITFRDGYWQNAPLNRFRYEADQLVPVD